MCIRDSFLPGWAKVQPYIFTTGMLIFGIAMGLAGHWGVPRRHWDISLSAYKFAAGTFDAPRIHMALAITALGATIAIVGGTMYVVVAAGTVFLGKRNDVPNIGHVDAGAFAPPAPAAPHVGRGFEAPGPSRFVAVLTVSATPDGGAPAVRTVRLPIDVDLRLPGAIEGRVLGADGQPLAGALVRAQQIAVARPLGLPFDPPSTDAALQADRGQNAGGAATDADGRYRLPVMPGNWAVRVDADRHKVQWFEGAAAQRDAKPVTVAAGATVASIDFQLVAADPTPTPVPMAAVSGIVRGADGLPLEGAVVRAIRAANSTIGDRSSTGAGGTRTGADGSYVLKVPVGAWLVAAEADGHVRQYWDHQVESRTATVVTLALDEVRPGIDFDLAHKPQATIRGTVLLADGTAAAGARVMAVRRDGPTDRNGQLPTTGPKVETNAQGEFVLSVEPGTYAVGASPKADRSSTPPVWRWWDGKGAIADADLLALADGAVREGVRIGLQ